MLGVKGIVGSDIPLVATYSIWDTSGIWLVFFGGTDWERSQKVQNVFFGLI